MPNIFSLIPRRFWPQWYWRWRYYHHRPRGFMDKVTFEHELGVATGPAPIYATEEECLQKAPCILESGMVEVEVRLVRVVWESNFKIPEADHA